MIFGFDDGVLGMLPSHVFVVMILVCRYVEINDTFLFGQLLEYNVVLWLALSDGGISVGYCD